MIYPRCDDLPPNVPILVHWGVNRHTVDKSGELSVIISNKNNLYKKVKRFCIVVNFFI
jgi:hypothetical protein